MVNEKELILSASKTCPNCDGCGELESKEDSTSATPVQCNNCVGTGAVMDNTIGDIILEHCPDIKRNKLGMIIEGVYNHFSNKLVDSYNRGVKDGKEHEALQ